MGVAITLTSNSTIKPGIIVYVRSIKERGLNITLPLKALIKSPSGKEKGLTFNWGNYTWMIKHKPQTLKRMHSPWAIRPKIYRTLLYQHFLRVNCGSGKEVWVISSSWCKIMTRIDCKKTREEFASNAISEGLAAIRYLI